MEQFHESGHDDEAMPFRSHAQATHGFDGGGMTSHDDIHRDIGRMEAGLESLKEVVREGFKGSNERLDKLESRMAALEGKESERKGGWRYLAALAGLLGTIGGLIAGFFK